MQRPNQAELFINTLENLLEAERESRRPRLRDRHRADAMRYMQAFPAEFEEGRAHWDWISPGDQSRRRG